MAAPTAQQLLALAVEQIKDEIQDGKGPAGPLARRIGLPYQRVYRWFNAGTGPDYEGAIAILDAFGWLNIPEDDQSREVIPRDPLEEIADGVARLLTGQGELIAIAEGLQRERTSQTTAARKKTASSRRKR